MRPLEVGAYVSNFCASRVELGFSRIGALYEKQYYSENGTTETLLGGGRRKIHSYHGLPFDNSDKKYIIILFLLRKGFKSEIKD